MNCANARRRWHEQREQTASAADVAELARHLEGCRACRRWAAQMDDLLAALGDLRMQTEALADAAPAQRPAALQHATRRGAALRRPDRRTTRVATWLALAAGVVLCAAVSYRALRGAGPASPGSGELPGAGLAQKPESTVPGRAPSTPSDEPPRAAPVTRVTLAGRSAAEFLSVEQATATPHVRLFRLYRRIDAATGDAGS